MEVSTRAYYGWNKEKRANNPEAWHLIHQMKALFTHSRNSLESRQMMKSLRKEGFDIGRYKTRKLMQKNGLFIPKKSDS